MWSCNSSNRPNLVQLPSSTKKSSLSPSLVPELCSECTETAPSTAQIQNPSSSSFSSSKPNRSNSSDMSRETSQSQNNSSKTISRRKDFSSYKNSKRQHVGARTRMGGLKNLLVGSVVAIILSFTLAHEAPEDGFFKREHSLVKPYSPAGVNIPFFDVVGDTMVTNNFVRITPDDKSRSGGIWNKVPVFQKAWEVHFTFKVHGQSRNLAADGMAFWYVKTPRQIGDVFGGADQFSGLGIFIDTYKNGQGSGAFPQISGMINDGSVDYDHDTDGQDQNLGSCYSMIRNREHDTHMSIRYKRRILTVNVDVDGQGSWRQCFTKTGVRLPGGYYFGVTAATGDLTDNHDVLAVRTYQLDDEEPAPAGWKELVPGIDGEELGVPNPDDHRNSASKGGSGGLVWTLFLLAIAICAVVGYVVFQKKQERNRHRFY